MSQILTNVSYKELVDPKVANCSRKRILQELNTILQVPIRKEKPFKNGETYT